MTQNDGHSARRLDASINESQISAFTGRLLDDCLYFESDFEGDLHAVAFATIEEASTWTVTCVHPDGTREPVVASRGVMFHKEETCGRPVWWADRAPGTQLEFRLPDGSSSSSRRHVDSRTPAFAVDDLAAQTAGVESARTPAGVTHGAGRPMSRTAASRRTTYEPVPIEPGSGRAHVSLMAPKCRPLSETEAIRNRHGVRRVR